MKLTSLLTIIFVILMAFGSILAMPMNNPAKARKDCNGGRNIKHPRISAMGGFIGFVKAKCHN